MKRRPQISRPPDPGPYVKGPLTELICEEDKAGRPLPPAVEWLSPRLPDEVLAELRAQPDEAPKPPPAEAA